MSAKSRVRWRRKPGSRPNIFFPLLKEREVDGEVGNGALPVISLKALLFTAPAPLATLRPLPLANFDAPIRLTARVASTSTIQVRSNTYSVHSHLIGEQVQILFWETTLEVYLGGERCNGDVFRRVLRWSVCHFTAGGRRCPGRRVWRRSWFGGRS
jgi:hypothetical protein